LTLGHFFPLCCVLEFNFLQDSFLLGSFLLGSFLLGSFLLGSFLVLEFGLSEGLFLSEGNVFIRRFNVFIRV
jgi:hypothetical protein